MDNLWRKTVVVCEETLTGSCILLTLKYVILHKERYMVWILRFTCKEFIQELFIGCSCAVENESLSMYLIEKGVICVSEVSIVLQIDFFIFTLIYKRRASFENPLAVSALQSKHMVLFRVCCHHLHLPCCTLVTASRRDSFLPGKRSLR